MHETGSALLRREDRRLAKRTRVSILILAGLIVAMTLLWMVGGCNAFDGSICTAQFVYGIHATVTDADTGEAVTPAGLTLEDLDSGYTEPMEESPSGSGIFVGAGERAGRYRLIITAGGYVQKVIDEVIVEDGGCHVIPVALDVGLSTTG